MNRVHNYQVIQVITLIIMVLVMFLIVFINSSSESIAVAENVSTMAAEEESAMLTESDDIAGYAGKTIRDYESVRTIPDISHDGIDLVLNTSTDDAIVKIVPKAYFMTAGNELYIGREYGFFIHTEHCADIAGSNNMYSTVLVFDIDNVTDMVANNDTAVTKVTVLYQYEFIYLSPQESHYTVLSDAGDFLITKINFDSAHSGIVIPLARHTADIRRYNQVDTYYLNDISFGASLMNVQNSNYGDSGYDPSQDAGAFFIAGTYSYQGKEYVDNKPTGSDAAQWFHSIATIAGGIVTLTPGFNLLGLALVGDGILFLVKDVVEAHIDTMQDVSGKCVNIVNEYNTRLSQVQYDGQLTKSLAIAVNSDQMRSYLFGVNDYVQMEYDISSTPTDKIPYTWFQREIGIKVVDKDGNKIVTPEVGSHDFKLYEEDYVDVNLNGGTAYLLPNESNTFTFVPEYSGEYSFDFGAGNSNVEFVVNGQAVNVGTNGFDVSMTGGETYDIRVSNKTNVRQIYDFSTEPSSDSTVSVGNHDEYVVKWSLTSPQFKTLTTDKGNISIEVYVKNANGTFDLYAPGGYAWISAPSMSFPFPAGEYYIVLKNITSSALTATLSANDVPVVTEGGNDVTFGRNWTYYRFTPSAASYTLTLDTDVDFAQMQLYDSSLQSVDIITGSMMFTANGLNSGARYYLAIRTDDTDNVSGDVVIEKSQNAYAWYIDGVKVNGNSVTLARDWEYDIELIVNDTVSLRELQQSSNEPFSHNAANVRNIHIPADVALGAVVTLHAYVTDDYVAAHYLNVTVAANNKIAISYENWTDTTDVNFQVNDALIQKINYEITYKNALFISESITGSVTVTKTGLYTASADIGSALIYNGKIKIQSIIYNGNELVLSTALSEITLNTNYGKGDGTAENPYKINAARHYMTFLFAAGLCDGTEATIYWTMGADVTIPDSFSIPIPEFYGVFDGGGYTLSGLTLEIPASSFDEEQNYGWAAINKGTIKNVKFTDVTISAPVWHSGAWVNIGVAAGTNAGLIENVEVMGADVNTNRNMSSVGGIAGCNDSGATVRNCIVGITIGNPNTVQIFSNGDTGLICGENWGTVDECLARLAAINYYATANNRSIGGIVGYCPAGELTNCTTLIVGITVAGADAGIVPSMGTIVGNIKSSVVFTGNEDATIMDLEKLPESQRANSNTGVSGTQYGYREE